MNINVIYSLYCKSYAKSPECMDIIYQHKGNWCHICQEKLVPKVNIVHIAPLHLY